MDFESCFAQVDKEECLQHVMIKAAYIGAKCGDFNRVSIIEADRELLDKLWLEARTEAEAASPQFVGLGAEVGASDKLGALLYHWMQARVLWKWLMLIGWQPVDASGKAIASKLLEEADPSALFKPLLDSQYHSPIRRKVPPF